MAYYGNYNEDDYIDYGRLASLFIVFGVISLLTAWIFSMDKEKVLSSSFRPHSTGAGVVRGPIDVKKDDTSFRVEVTANLPLQSWAFVEGQVLDANQQYLFSFGKEFWHEQGRDSDGAWREQDTKYSINITLPKKGRYYLKFVSDSNKNPNQVTVTLHQKRGSSLPHIIFGVITLLIGIVLNEIKNATLINLAMTGVE